jgi:Seryl-tRNA synthetase
VIDRREFRLRFAEMGAALKRRGLDVESEDSPWLRARELDGRQRALKAELEALQAERNRVSRQIGMKKSRNEDAAPEMAQMARLAGRIKLLEARAKEAEEAFSSLLLEVGSPGTELEFAL